MRYISVYRTVDLTFEMGVLVKKTCILMKEE